VGFHWFDDTHATSYNDRHKKLSRGTLEYNAGAEYDINKVVTVSAGWQNTSYGLTDEYMDDKSFVVSSNSAGLGACLHITKKMSLNVAYFRTFYNHKKTAETVEATKCTYTADYTRTNDVFGVGLDIKF
jgi:long-chain fatty acid transport protein